MKNSLKLIFLGLITFLSAKTNFASPLPETTYKRSKIIDVMPTSYQDREIIPFPWQKRGTFSKKKADLPCLPPSLRAKGVSEEKWNQYFERILSIRKIPLSTFASIYAQVLAGPLTLGGYSYFVGCRELKYSTALMDWIEGLQQEVLEPAGLFGKFQMHYGFTESYGESSVNIQPLRMWIAVSLNEDDSRLLQKESEYWVSDKHGNLSYRIKNELEKSDIQITPAGCFLDCAAAPYFP